MSSGIWVETEIEKKYYPNISIFTIKNIDDNLKDIDGKIYSIKQELLVFSLLKKEGDYDEVLKNFNEIVDYLIELIKEKMILEHIKEDVSFEFVTIYDENYGYYVKYNNEFVSTSKEKYEIYWKEYYEANKIT